MIERLTGRRVWAFLSQVSLDPAIDFEVFVLEPPRDGGRESPAQGDGAGRSPPPGL